MRLDVSELRAMRLDVGNEVRLDVKDVRDEMMLDV